MATEEESVESYELGEGELITASQTDWVGQTFGQEGVRGAYQVSYHDMPNLESRRLIADIPSPEEAQRLVTGIGRAEERHQERTSRARTVDEQKKAPLTTNYEQWASNPRRWDYPGVDDPRTQGPEATGYERFRHQMEKDPENISLSTPGPDVVDYRDLEDNDRPRAGAQSVPPETTPGVGTIEADDEAVWERGDYGVGTLERDDVANWETGSLLTHRDRLFEGHEAARKGLRARGVRPGKTDYSDDELMKDYLSDVRAVEKELYARGELG